MTTIYSTNLLLAKQGTGDNSNTWGSVLNSQVIDYVDQCLGSKLSLSVAGSSDATLSTAQSQNLYFSFTGILTGDINVIFPAASGRIIIVNNATTGSYTLGVKNAGGTALLIPQGATALVLLDAAAGVAKHADDGPLNIETSIASAATTDIASLGSNVAVITGTTTITSLGSSASTANCMYVTRFTGILTLMHNASSLILPGGTNITTAAGDCFIWKYEGSGNWRCICYQPVAGYATGTVNAGTADQLAYYATSAAAVSGTNALPSSTTATTQTAGDSSTKVATTAFVNSTALTLANGSTATTQTAGDNSTKVATTAYVDANSSASGSQTYSTAGSNSLTIPAAAKVVFVQLWGAGGGGGGNTDSFGGAGGSYKMATFPRASLSSSVTVTVGAGGSGGGAGTNGSAGGNTSFGSYLVAYGGSGGGFGGGGGIGQGGQATAAGAIGSGTNQKAGVASSLLVNLSSTTTVETGGDSGGNAYLSGAGGAGISAVAGTSTYGGSGGAIQTNGTAPGGGGGGVYSLNPGGNGAAGKAIIMWW